MTFVTTGIDELDQRLGMLQGLLGSGTIEISVGATSAHAIFVQEGTSRMAANPFLTRTIEEAVPLIVPVLMDGMYASFDANSNAPFTASLAQVESILVTIGRSESPVRTGELRDSVYAEYL